MKLSYKNFYVVWNDALVYLDINNFIKKWKLIFLNNAQQNIDEDKLDNTLAEIWSLAHMSIEEIRKKIGVSKKDFQMFLCVSPHTMEKWTSPQDSNRHREPSPYIKLLIAERFNLIDLRYFDI